MTTLKDFQELQARIATLRSQLIANSSAELLQNPELAEALLDPVEEQVRLLEQTAASQPPPPDGGLAELIGLGSGASTSFEATRFISSFESFDETVTSERILAVGDLYFLYQHEKLGVFRTIFRLRDLFKAGTVRLSDGPGAFGLYQFDRKQTLRFTSKDRLQAYRRVFGYTRSAPPPGSKPNREFHRLFVNFNQQVAQFYRDKRVSEVIRPQANAGTFGSVAVVRRAGLDLRNNVKGAAYGHVNVLRVEALQLLDEAFRILRADDIRRIFGADTAWDVIEEVSRRYLGQPQINASQRSRIAAAGRDVLRWLAQGYILNANRTQFEALLVEIADSAEEWLTSAETLGTISRPVKRSKRKTRSARNKEYGW